MNNLVNRKFGRLFVLYRTNDYISPNGKHLIKWHCKCDCGNEIDVLGCSLTKGNTKSCGCLQKEIAKQICLNKRKQNIWIKCNNKYIFKDSNNIEGSISINDYEKCKNLYWFARWNYHTNSYYFYSYYNSTLLSMSRFILNVNDNHKVDHINHNTTDNTRENLRKVTNSSNTMNRVINKNSTSKVTGVNWHKKSGKWSVRIGVNNKRIQIGLFDDFEDAVKARKIAEEKYFGEYSYDNSIRNR